MIFLIILGIYLLIGFIGLCFKHYYTKKYFLAYYEQDLWDMVIVVWPLAMPIVIMVIVAQGLDRLAQEVIKWIFN